MYLVIYEGERILNRRKFHAWGNAFATLEDADEKAKEFAAKNKQRCWVAEFPDPPAFELVDKNGETQALDRP